MKDLLESLQMEFIVGITISIKRTLVVGNGMENTYSLQYMHKSAGPEISNLNLTQTGLIRILVEPSAYRTQPNEIHIHELK